MASKDLGKALETIKAKCIKNNKPYVLTIAKEGNCHGIESLTGFSPRRQEQIRNKTFPNEILFNANGKAA